MSLTAEDTTGGELGMEPSWRRGRRLLLAEQAFARCVGATLAGTFLTALVVALGGEEFELGVASAAGRVGAIGMLLANPLINRLGSRRRFCLICLGAVRALRLAIAAVPMLVYAGVAPRSLLWPAVGMLLVSAFCGMSGEISRRAWIGGLVPAARRGQYFGWRIMIASCVHAVILPVGGKLLDVSEALTGRPLVGLTALIGFGAMMGWCGWALLYRAPEPALPPPRRRTGLVRSILLPWLRPRFRPLLVAAAWWALAAGICSGFFDFYMLRHVGMKWAWIAAVNTAGHLAALAGAPLYGAWADRAGARRLLILVIAVKGIFPAAWLLVSPEHWQLAFLVVGLRTFNSAGQICWIRLSLNLSPQRNQAAFLAMHQAMMGLGHALGAFGGGKAAEALRQMSFQLDVLGFRLVGLHVLFLVSAALRLTALPLLGLIREPRKALSPAGKSADPSA